MSTDRAPAPGVRRNPVATAAPWAALAAGSALGYHLLLQHGRVLLRLEALERRLDDGQQPSTPSLRGLPPGTLVPDFDLPVLTGGRATLRSFRGQRVLLLFFDPGCGFCRAMLPDLAALGPAGAQGRPTPILLATGDADETRRLVQEHALAHVVLLHDESNVAGVLEVAGTPTGYLLDEDGATVGELAVGAEELLVLARSAAPEPEGAAAADGTVRAPRLRTRPLSTSRLVRDGLPAGTPAPAFTLPRVDGGEVSLADFSGRRLLLVFSDPECGPCSALLPELEDLPDRVPGLAVLVISRRGREANQRKVAELGMTTPVVLQRSWEVSRDYGIFATPVAYVVDERGVLATGPAAGAAAIRELVDAIAPPRHAVTHAP